MRDPEDFMLEPNMSTATEHLRLCEGCDHCDHLMSMYIACDRCGSLGHMSVGYYVMDDGETWCNECYEKLND